jgi:hypothetical protein
LFLKATKHILTMANKATSDKDKIVTVSSGRKTKKAGKTKNFKNGVNPHTGKEFLVVRKKDNVYNVIASFQTRMGAELGRCSGEKIISSGSIESRIAANKKHAEKMEIAPVDWSNILTWLNNKPFKIQQYDIQEST